MPSSAFSDIKAKPASFVNKLNLLWLFVTVLVFGALVKLGWWQSDRALVKEQRLAQIERLTAQEPITLEQIVALAGDYSSVATINDYPVIMNGDFNSSQVFLLDNQVSNGRLGYRVYQVMQTPQHAVLISLGWVLGSINRAELPKVNALEGNHQFRGHIRLHEQGIQLQAQTFEQATWPLRVQQIELDKFSVLIERQLLPFIVYVDKNEQLGFEKNWQPIVMPPEKHRAYAFQWFSLALAWLLLMLWARFGTTKNKKKAT